MKTSNFYKTVFTIKQPVLNLALGSFLFCLSVQAQVITYSFTNCGATGAQGPSQGLVNTAYAATNLNGSVSVVTQGIQQWTVPASGVYRIETYGAQGGPSWGLGAYMSGDFTLTAGQVLRIVVGQAGASQNGSHGSGGGGSYVAIGSTPLIVAGGGGGRGASSTVVQSFSHGSTLTAGQSPSGGAPGGTGGGGGSAASGTSGGTFLTPGSNASGSVWSSGGGGFYTNGGLYSGGTLNGGRAFVNNALGGDASGGSGNSPGGFGGGGGCGDRGAGGGGYSGGGGGTNNTDGGGGGGSFNSGSNQINTPGLRTGHGLVVISTSSIVTGGGGPLPGTGGGTISFAYTGSSQSFTVPSCVNTITFDVRGAKGGSGYPSVSQGGNGGRITGVLTVTPGQVLEINVGGQGSNALSSGTGGAGGFNGGAVGASYSGSYGGGGGGGASDIRFSPFGVTDRKIVAGGGGGGAYNASTTNYDRGGSGGGTVGGAGYSNNSIGGTAPGGGGTQSAGGGAGFWSGYCSGTAGSLFSGGAAGVCSNSGGGGGGGYYGGGGGVWAGGGGGSNYADVSVSNSITHSQGVQTAAGAITFTLGFSGTPINSITATPSVICPGGSATLSTSGMMTYTWTGSSGFISGASSVVVTPTSTSIYTVSATDSFGCVGGYSVTVPVSNLPTITVNSGTVCAGNVFTFAPGGAVSYSYSTGANTVSPLSTNIYTVIGANAFGCVAAAAAVSSVTVVARPVVTVNSGTVCSGGSFTMTPSGGVTYTYSSGGNVVNPTTATNYSVVGTGTNGCTSLPAVSSVTVAPLPTISVASGSVCAGRVYSIVPTGASTYTLNTGANGTSFTVSPLFNTNYLVTGSSSQGCVSSGGALASLTVVTSPTVSVSSGTICSGNTYSIVASGASSYTYSGGGPLVSPGISTSYSVVGTNSLGCVSVNTAVSTVTVYITPTITAPNGQICQGQTYSFMPSGANSYVYSSTTPTVSPIVTTTYSLSGVSAQGCPGSNTAVVTVSVFSAPTIAVNSGSVCSGRSFTLTPSGAFTYSYSGGTQIVSPTSNTIYFVTGVSAQGCASSNTAISTVSVFASPTISINSGSICSGNTFTLQPVGAGTFTYLNGGPIVQPASTTVYSVVSSNSLGCNSNLAVATITVMTTPTVSVNSGTICSGQSFIFQPTGASQYSFVPGITGPSVSPLATTVYSIIGFSSGCVSSSPATATVYVNSSPTISVANGSICSGQSFVITPAGAATYSFSSGSATVSPASNSSYIVTGTSASGCAAVNSATCFVVVNPLPTVSVNNGSICSGQSFTLLPTGAATYSYSSGSQVITPSANTTVSVVGISTAGCVSANGAVSSITVAPSPTIGVTSSRSSLCVGESATLTASGALSYTWNASVVLAFYPISPTVITSYSVAGTNSLGCTTNTIYTQLVDPCTSLANISDVEIVLAPNPNNGVFELQVPQAFSGRAEVYDALGNMVVLGSIEEGRTTLDISHLSNGLYFVRVYNKATLAGTRRVIKQ